MRKAFITPTKYVQGEDELLNLGYFVKTFGDKALLIGDPFALNLVKDKLEETQKKWGIELVYADGFEGECCRSVITKLQAGAANYNCSSNSSKVSGTHTTGNRNGKSLKR